MFAFLSPLLRHIQITTVLMTVSFTATNNTGQRKSHAMTGLTSAKPCPQHRMTVDAVSIRFPIHAISSLLFIHKNQMQHQRTQKKHRKNALYYPSWLQTPTLTYLCNRLSVSTNDTPCHQFCFFCGHDHAQI